MNIKYDAKSGEVTVSFKYDEKGDYKASQSGKRLIVASTHGFTNIPGTTVQLSLNATVMPK